MLSGLTFLTFQCSPAIPEQNEEIWYALQVAGVVLQDDAVFEHPPNVLDHTTLEP
jgi:hypothetical protein